MSIEIYNEARKKIKEFLEKKDPNLLQAFVLVGKLDLIFEMLIKRNNSKEVKPKKRNLLHDKDTNIVNLSNQGESFSLNEERGRENKP
jgi:hypothetical protein